ncbi:MAG: transcription antitermination factor NusB [bacterium]
MRLALAEILYMDSVPLNVAISEAVRIAKKYGTEHSSRFINGILGKFSRERFQEQ